MERAAYLQREQERQGGESEPDQITEAPATTTSDFRPRQKQIPPAAIIKNYFDMSFYTISDELEYMNEPDLEKRAYYYSVNKLM